jgi:hypothetical protein
MIVPTQFQQNMTALNLSQDDEFKHPLSSEKRRFVFGDRFQSNSAAHKSPLCKYHNIDLCMQSSTIKTSYHKFNNRTNKSRNRSSCKQGIAHHYFYNYLMTFYENEEIVLKQKNNLENSTGKQVKRDDYKRFIV